MFTPSPRYVASGQARSSELGRFSVLKRDGWLLRYIIPKKNDPPDYSVTGESTLGTLIIRGEPLSVRLGEPYKAR